MLDIVPVFKGILTLMAVLSLFYSALSVLPSYEVFSYRTAVAEQGAFLTLKALGEAYSYAYYVEVNGNFDPSKYSDETNEQWDVPGYFSYPAGNAVATCESVDGRIGCTVWNLEGGDKNDPCPTVKDYTPNPDPNTMINYDPTSNEVDNYFQEVEGNLSEVLKNYGIDLSYTKNIRVLGTLLRGRVDLLERFPEGNFSKRINATWNFTRGTKTVPGKAYCECNFGTEINTVATYDMNVVLLDLKGSVDGVNLLDENTVFIRYFTGRHVLSSQKNPIYCYMVIK